MLEVDSSVMSPPFCGLPDAIISTIHGPCGRTFMQLFCVSPERRALRDYRLPLHQWTLATAEAEKDTAFL